jgi:hypothetical protein
MSSPPHSPCTADLDTPAAEAAGEEARMAASKSKPAAGGRKKPARVWSDADEVRILERLAEYAAVHGGATPAWSKLEAFFKGCDLDKAEFTVSVIYEKVRRLREKYCKLRDAGGPLDPAPAGGDGDEVRKYKLSKEIWGDLPAKVGKKRGSTSAAAVGAPPAILGVRRGLEELQGGEKGAKAGKKRDSTIAAAVGAPPAILGVRRGLEELHGLFPCLAAEVDTLTDDDMLAPVLKSAFELIDDQKAGELNDKVKKQLVEEAEMSMSGGELRNEVLQTLLRSMHELTGLQPSVV